MSSLHARLAICSRVDAWRITSACTPSIARTAQPSMSCAAMGANFPPTICTTPGPTISTGTANSSRKVHWMRKLLAATVVLSLAISAAAAEERYLYDVITQPAYKHAISTIVAGQPLASWVKAVLSGEEGLGTPGKTVAAGGASYELYDVCQPHNC